MNYSESELQGLHATLYEIISEIDRICQKHNIRYFVTGGTAIGAHFWQAIIPRDDDVDIGMTRENYERFLSVAPDELAPVYFLQTPETEKHTVPRKMSLFPCSDAGFAYSCLAGLGVLSELPKS